MDLDSLNWKLRKKEEPDPDKYEYILVIGVDCGLPHVAYYLDDEWNRTDFCCSKGKHFAGPSIDFKKWIPLCEISKQNAGEN